MADILANVATNANRVIQWIRQSDLPEEELIRSNDLARLLDEFRMVGPMAFRCGQERCATTIAYVALSNADARIEFGPKRRTGRSRGVYPTEEPSWGSTARWHEDEITISAAADLDFADLDFQGRFAPYLEWAMTDEATVQLATNPDVGAPYPLRFTFICPRCHAQYPYTNSTLLVEFLKAVYRGWRDIRPGRV